MVKYCIFSILSQFNFLKALVAVLAGRMCFVLDFRNVVIGVIIMGRCCKMWSTVGARP